MSKLLIVESPGKIKKISEYLGDEYIVMASIGHIIDLDETKMSIDIETFEPQYKIYDDKMNVVDNLIKKTIKVGKNNVLLGADEDREGEMIAWSLAKELKITNPKRIVFNSITKKELENAVANPKSIDLSMVKAQQARRILDRFAGYLLSPLLTKIYYGAKSAGRVQSVVVKIVVDREREINSFFDNKNDSYFIVNSNTSIGSEFKFLSKLCNKNTLIDEIKDKDDAYNEEELNNDELNIDELEEELNKKKGNKKVKVDTKNKLDDKTFIKFSKNDEDLIVDIIKNMAKSKYQILNLNLKVKKTYPPAPYTTSTLQQDASKRFGMDSKRTMGIAQKLYHDGHITYMRTDSTSISTEASKVIKEKIIQDYSEKYYEYKEYKNKKENTQEAHECVRPTKIQYNEIEGTGDEKKLYNIIWKRTIMSQMKPAEYQSFIIEIEMLERKILDKYKLVGTLDNLIFEGYLIVDGKKGNTPIEENDLKKKKLDWIDINGIEDTEKPPVRYNDASLINKMDPKNLNIGRPSTYATFIEKIIKRKYVEIKDVEGKKMNIKKYQIKKDNPKVLDLEEKEVFLGKEKKKLVPTELGLKTTEFLEKNFNKIMNYDFTANMEKDLDNVAEGKKDKNVIIKVFYEYINECLGKVNLVDIKTNNSEIIGNYLDINIILHNGKFGRYIVYDKHKFNMKYLFNGDENENINNKKILDKTIEEIKKKDNPKVIGTYPKVIGTYNKIDIILNDGKYGKYITYDTYKYGLNYLLGKITNDLDKELEELDNPEEEKEIDDDSLAKLAIDKIEKQNSQKKSEWIINSNKKYILKEGKFGYYVEEWNTKINEKKNNYSLKSLFYKISKEDNIDIKDNENIIKKITKDKITEYIKEQKEKTKE
jgi:DNA topoisomerase-1